jgi:DNA-binding transcriptional MerR regulator
MTIGDLALRTGVAVKVLRRQQDMGLIYTRGRSPAGYRLFDENALRCVQVVRGLRDLGLTEAEIAQLASCCDDDPWLVRPQLTVLLARSQACIDARYPRTRAASGSASTPSSNATTKPSPGATRSGGPMRGNRPHRIGSQA